MTKYMTAEQAKGILRALIAAAGGWLVAKGFISSETWDWLLGGLVTTVPIVWSWYKNRPQHG